MAVKLISLMSWIIVTIMMLPQDWFPEGCTIGVCHNRGCPHAGQVFADSFWYPYAAASTSAVIQGLKSMGSYKIANLVVYFGGVPAFAVINGWLSRQRWFWYVGMIVSVSFMFVIGQVSSPVGSMPQNFSDFTWYYYCTEFCMRIANATGLTYGGVCFFIFVVAIPGVLFTDFIWGLWKRWLYKKSFE